MPEKTENEWQEMWNFISFTLKQSRSSEKFPFKSRIYKSWNV